jgi:hypothetical protein
VQKYCKPHVSSKSVLLLQGRKKGPLVHGKPAFARMLPRNAVICRLHFSIRPEQRHQQMCIAGRSCLTLFHLHQ